MGAIWAAYQTGKQTFDDPKYVNIEIYPTYIRYFNMLGNPKPIPKPGGSTTSFHPQTPRPRHVCRLDSSQLCRSVGRGR